MFNLIHPLTPMDFQGVFKDKDLKKLILMHGADYQHHWHELEAFIF